MLITLRRKTPYKLKYKGTKKIVFVRLILTVTF